MAKSYCPRACTCAPAQAPRQRAAQRSSARARADDHGKCVFALQECAWASLPQGCRRRALPAVKRQILKRIRSKSLPDSKRRSGDKPRKAEFCAGMPTAARCNGNASRLRGGRVPGSCKAAGETVREIITIAFFFRYIPDVVRAMRMPGILMVKEKRTVQVPGV